MSRKPFIAGNWKMNKTIGEGMPWLMSSRERSRESTMSMWPFARLCVAGQGGRCAGGKQDNARRAGYFLEGVRRVDKADCPAACSLDACCQWVIVGHSETRGRFGTVDDELAKVLAYFGESDVTRQYESQGSVCGGADPDNRLRRAAFRARGR